MSATRLSPSRRREDIRAWWAAHMKAQQDSGQSQVAYWRARGLDPKYFTLWKRKLRGPGVAAETVEPARLVPVVVRANRTVSPSPVTREKRSMGGALALQLAIHEPRLVACVVHYGALPTNPADIEKINARTLGLFGVLDRGISPNKVRAFEKRMNALKKLVEITIYEGAGHAFENPTNIHTFRPRAAADAWLRTLTFLNQSL